MVRYWGKGVFFVGCLFAIVAVLIIGWLYSVGGGIAVLVGIVALIIIFSVWASSSNSKDNEAQREFAKEYDEYIKRKEFKTSKTTMVGERSVAFDFGKEAIIFSTKPIALNGRNGSIDYYSYSDMIDVELLISGLAPMSASMGGALVGGVLAGATGAIIGSAKGKKEMCDNIAIKILHSDANHAVDIIRFIQGGSIERNSEVYNRITSGAQEVFSTLQSILHEKTKANTPAPVSPVPAPSPAPAPADSTEELRKYKQLLDDGIITQDDFDAKKRQILGV